MTTDSNISRKRSSRLQKNILVSFVAKGWSAVIVLLSVPVTLNCLGEYNNGVWLTISSIMLWIDQLDIGLGNGMRNKLAAYLAHGEKNRARTLVSSTFAMLTYIIIPTLLLLLICFLSIDTYGLLNVEHDRIANLNEVLMVTATLVCTTFVFKLIGNFYMGLQLPAVSNLLIAMGQTLALIGTYIVYLAGSHSLLHILNEAKGVVSMGIQFFIIQATGVILFMTSNILISQFFSPSMVTPYQITYRYFSIMLVFFTVICMPFWNATTDAYERGDMQWIHNATRKLRLMTIGIIVCMILMVLISDTIYNIWIGPEITIDIRMSIAVAAYILIIIYSMRYSYFINGIGKLRLQLICSGVAAILFIPAVYLAVRWTGDIVWFIVVMCLINIPGLIVNRIQFKKLINGQATGIWNR